MRRFTAIVALVLAFIGAGAAKPRERTIYVKDTSHLTPAQINDALSAVQDAVEKDFYPVWHEHAKLVLLKPGQRAPKGAWVIKLVDYPPCLGCAGFHSTTAAGVPYAVVGTAVGIDPWGVFTHELWEMLVDPKVNDSGTEAKTIQVGEDRYILETADPVESDKFAYYRTSKGGARIEISDFVTPAWFDPASDVYGNGVVWDFTHSCSKPLEVLEDGYQLVWRGGVLITLGPGGVVQSAGV